jgi:hypothetical protein
LNVRVCVRAAFDLSYDTSRETIQRTSSGSTHIRTPGVFYSSEA